MKRQNLDLALFSFLELPFVSKLFFLMMTSLDKYHLKNVSYIKTKRAQFVFIQIVLFHLIILEFKNIFEKNKTSNFIS